MELNRDGVSESIGYLIIFGLILSGIGLITLYGYPLLIQQESSANLRNMEQTMIVLQNDIKSLTYKLANYKETSLRVSGGSLFSATSLDTPQKFTIQSISDGSIPLTEFFPGEIRYLSTSDNTVITLENGAVIMKPLGTKGSVMLAEPRWYLDVDPEGKKTLIINYISLGNWTANHRAANMSQTGVGTVRMHHLQTIVWSNPMGDWPLSNGVIKIQYYPNNKASIMPDGYGLAWRTYLTDPTNLNMLWDGNDNPYSFTISGLKNIVVKEYDIMVETL